HGVVAVGLAAPDGMVAQALRLENVIHRWPAGETGVAHQNSEPHGSAPWMSGGQLTLCVNEGHARKSKDGLLQGLSRRCRGAAVAARSPKIEAALRPSRPMPVRVDQRCSIFLTLLVKFCFNS